MRLIPYLLLLVINTIYFAQSDETKYPWPTPSFNSSRGLTATFGEFRNTGSADHFHNAVDIGEPDGNPVYPCIDGTVYSIVNSGYNSYINIKSIIDGKKKHITYYHVVPNPALTLNQEVIAGQTIIGSIYVGAAHVHLIERELMNPNLSSIGNEINPVRPEGGLNPYFDTQSPIIETASIKYFKDNSSIELSKDNLFGKVDIRIKVREQNGNYSSQLNNGTYILGYRILSADGSTIVYEPMNDGIKYRFYFIPGDGFVHNVFAKGVATLSDPIYWLTNGMGEQQINSTLSVTNNYFDTDLLEDGSYLLEIFTEDTRANKASKRVSFKIEKLPPELRYVLSKNDSIKIKWIPYELSSIKGYRIYYSQLTGNDWQLAADETQLGNQSNSILFESGNDFQVPSGESQFKYYITAIDSMGNESIKSDIYSSTHLEKNPKVLIVDGFDRFGGNGSWEKSNHNFNTLYSSSIEHDQYSISSCSNEAIKNDEIDLNEYDFVIWFLGDESIKENTLENKEQAILANYLESGGNLFISGEDIGQDLDTEHNYNEFADTLFYHQYLKANLVHDGLDLLFEVNGESNTLFENLNVKFGEVYHCDAPDDIEPINGATPILNYTYIREDSSYRKGGIAYTGTFGESTRIGKMIYLSFPFESISDSLSRLDLMGRFFSYFNSTTVSVERTDKEHFLLKHYKLNQNFPNPFNPSTIISYTVPNIDNSMQRVQIRIFDILGQEMETLVDKIHSGGNYHIPFDGSNYTSGIYYYQLISENFIETKKMILIK